MENSKITVTEKVRRVKIERKLIIFINIKGIVHNEFAPLGHTLNSSYYCDVSRRLRKMHESFTPNFGDKITRCCIAATAVSQWK
jgi:hypothetical protein